MTRKSEIIEKFKAEKPEMLIIIAMGGDSSEREVSMVSGKAVFKSLKSGGKYDLLAVDIGADFPGIILAEKPDFVFNALHGLHGEDGALPGMLEIMGVKYSHSSVFASAIGMNKVAAKALFASSGIKCPPGMVISKSMNLKEEPIRRPFVIKPVQEGSSIGVDIVFEGDEFDISKYEFKYGDCLMEEYIPGQEIQVAVLDDVAIGAIEIVPTTKFYDYQAKYTEGFAKHVMPADLPKEKYQEVLDIAQKAHILLECSGVSRADFRFNNKTGEFFLLEINTHPGMTPLSLVPEIAAYVGITFDELIEKIIKSAMKE